jgi:hypothetical protein
MMEGFLWWCCKATIVGLSGRDFRGTLHSLRGAEVKFGVITLGYNGIGQMNLAAFHWRDWTCKYTLDLVVSRRIA